MASVRFDDLAVVAVSDGWLEEKQEGRESGQMLVFI